MKNTAREPDLQAHVDYAPSPFPFTPFRSVLDMVLYLFSQSSKAQQVVRSPKNAYFFPGIVCCSWFLDKSSRRYRCQQQGSLWKKDLTSSPCVPYSWLHGRFHNLKLGFSGTDLESVHYDRKSELPEKMWSALTFFLKPNDFSFSRF